MATTKNTTYQGNANLKRGGVKEEYTADQIAEILRCKDDYIYFIKKFIHIINLDEGLIKFNLYDFQEDLIDACKGEFLTDKLNKENDPSSTGDN